MLFSDSDRFKKPVINHPIDKQILCHIKPNTERHVGPGTYFSTSIEEKRSGWKPTSFSRRQPMTPVKVHQQNGYASRQDLYENGIIFSDGFMALPTSETKVVLPGPGDYNIPSDLVGDNSPHLKSSRKGATMGSSPRFACNPPNNLLYNDVLFSCSQTHHPNVSPGEYNMFQSCELIKNSHNIRAVSAASTATLGRSMSVAKLKKIKEKQLVGSTVAGDVSSPLSFHRSPLAEGTASGESSNSPNVFDLPPNEINSNSNFISSHGRQYTPGSSIHRTKKLQKQQPLRPKPLTDVRLTFGAPGSSFRIPSLSDVLGGSNSNTTSSSGDFSPNNGGFRPQLLRSNTYSNSSTTNNSKGQQRTAFSNHGSPAGDIQSSVRATSSSHHHHHHRSASGRAWPSPSPSSPQPQQGRAYQKHANSEPESIDTMFSDRRNLTDESIHDITGLHMSPLPFDDISAEIELYNKMHNNNNYNNAP